MLRFDRDASIPEFIQLISTGQEAIDEFMTFPRKVLLNAQETPTRPPLRPPPIFVDCDCEHIYVLDVSHPNLVGIHGFEQSRANKRQNWLQGFRDVTKLLERNAQSMDRSGILRVHDLA